MGSLGRDTPLSGRPQCDLGEWMINQQRQFQEFDRSFDTSFHTTPGFGKTFGDFFSPFSRPNLALQSSQQQAQPPPPPAHVYPIVPDRAMSQSSDMSPKAKVSYDADKFQVEFNVEDYTPEELSIETEGDVLIVLAKHETKAESGQSFVSKQFEQRFSLPSGVKIEKIASSLSKDGVLTVSAPRENLAISSGAIENKTGQVFSQTEEAKRSEGLPQPKVSYDDNKFQISLDVTSYRPEDLDVKVEGNSIIITAKQEIQEQGGTRTRVFEQKFSLPSGVKAELVKSSLTREGVLMITAPKGNVAAKQSYTESVENKMDKVLDPSSWEVDDRRRASNFNSAFNDMRKGSAFDSALSSTRQGSSMFDSSRSSILDCDRSGSLFDRDERSLFAANSEQNGISRVQYDDDSYKILVNVENYNPEELVIKTVDNTVIVEAKHEEKTPEGRSYSTQSFNQSFTLPRGVNPESVTSALSKEGVLTITAPLPKAVKSSNSERLVPIKNYLGITKVNREPRRG